MLPLVRRSARILSLLVAILLTSLFFANHPTRATVEVCSASVSPTSVNRNTNANLQFQIDNTDNVAYNWVKITRPSSVWTINGGSASGWGSSTVSNNETTFTGGTIAAGASNSFTLHVTTADSTLPSTSWTVEVSDSGGGSPFGCSGSLEVAVTDPSSNPTPQISGLSATNVTSSSATIVWTTDLETNSLVEYGLVAEEWTGAASDPSATTSHSLTVVGLSANTTYYYKVTSFVPGGNGVSSASSFTTAVSGETTSAQPATDTTTTTITTTTTTAEDTTPPSISVSTSFSKPYKTAPTVYGIAGDEEGVAKVEYSLDGGRNWLSANLGSTGAFSLTLRISEDGNYEVLIRAIDKSGNTSETKSYTLLIDRLPPQVGGSFFSLGPQVLASTQEGFFRTAVGVKQKITLSAIGGPNQIEILVGEKTFSLSRDTASGFWSGEVDFGKPGVYDLTVRGLDGAGNETTKKMGSVQVLTGGQVTHKDSGVAGVTLSVHAFTPILNEFTLWDGTSYFQENPIETDEAGRYSLFLPAGKYYLEITAPGFRKIRTNIFELDEATPVTTGFNLARSFIPFFNTQTIDFKLEAAAVPQEKRLDQALVGKTSSLADSQNSWVSFLSLWHPQTAAQITILEEVVKRGKNVLAVFPQESEGKVKVFQKRGGYQLTMIADPDGQLSKDFEFVVFPLHFFVDEKNVIKEVKAGILGVEEF